jgi:RimJ/RimL family protein N-acetyltransferase
MSPPWALDRRRTYRDPTRGRASSIAAFRDEHLGVGPLAAPCQALTMALTFRRVVVPEDTDILVTLLSENEWPFHGRTALSPDEAATVSVASAGIESYWIVDHDAVVGLVRLLDLDDVEDGSPLFDLRIGEQHRGRGVGTLSVRWLTKHLFETYETLHRIEATTRDDNVAMRSVLERCGYRVEGVLREAWRNENGSRSNTIAYGLLRSEWLAIDLAGVAAPRRSP